MSISSKDEALIRAAATSPDALVEFLVDVLRWPLPDGFEPQDVPLLDWSFDDLHLDHDQVARLTAIKQLPKFIDKQPFGIFVLEFDGGVLPVGAVRRVVNRLVRKKRVVKGDSAQQWNLHDLLFFCQSSGGVGTLHIVAFSEGGNKPVMKVISWDSNSPDARIELVASQNLPSLRWPDDSVMALAHGWRTEWLSSFTATYRQGVKSASVLAKLMAKVAREVRQQVADLYAVETDDGPLRELYSEMRKNLRGDLTPSQFADMYAQTMVYGLLTARITHPEEFAAEALNSALTFQNPFLDALYSSFRAKGDTAFDVDEFGLHDLAELLATVDANELLSNFGTDSHREDPVVFFYEEFLQEYDPQQRKELGTYYTPVPIVRFMVNAVDDTIKDHFGLPLGVADGSNWGTYSLQTGQAVPAGLTEDEPVIRMLDPATGTGTFLLEWMRRAWANLEGAGDESSASKGQVMRRMDAFEISLSSYAVAELKASLELPVELRTAENLRIRLTDSLAGKARAALLDDDPIAHEGRAAELTKFTTRHSVVVGNPPYMRVDGQTGGGWIAQPVEGKSLFDDIHAPARSNTIFSHQASLYNLYVYFWRLALWKAFEQTPSGPAITSFITASSWLSGPGFLGLRQLARELADEIFVIDLGGDNNGARTDENVFPIKTPVAIVILVRRAVPNPKIAAQVMYRRVEGTRAEKLDQIAALRMGDPGWAPASADWHAPLVPRSGGADWHSYPALVDLIPWQQPGCMWNRTWPVAPTPELLDRRWTRLVSTSDLFDRVACFVEGSSGRGVQTKVAGLAKLIDEPIGAAHQPITRFGHRSFDRQWSLQDPRLAKTESPALWASLSPNQVFMVALTTAQLGPGPAATASVYVPDKHYFHGRGGKDIFPLFRDASGALNVDPNLLACVVEQLGDAGLGITGQDLFAYVYGVLAGADYTTRFHEQLTTPGPRIPITANAALFRAMTEHGSALLWLQTYGERFGSPERIGLAVSDDIAWSPEPTSLAADLKVIHYSPGSRQIVIGEGVLNGVSPEVWAFKVSGMPVVKKWLGYRTGKGSGRAASSKSPLDKVRPTAWDAAWSQELRELVYVLTESLKLWEIGTGLLDEIVSGPLISGNDLPQPLAHLRRPPNSTPGSHEQAFLDGV